MSESIYPGAQHHCKTQILWPRLIGLAAVGTLGVLLVMLVLLSLNTRSHATDGASPWTVFVAPSSYANLLNNPSFEQGTSVTATDWADFQIDSDVYSYTIDSIGGRDGGRALKLLNLAPTDTLQGGAVQVITLNQTLARPVYFSGWSRFACTEGVISDSYSIYLDVYTDTEANASWGHTLLFDTDTCTWQFRESYIILGSPIQTIRVHALLRWGKVGTAWFDDLSVREVAPGIQFDSVLVSETHPSPPPYGGANLLLATEDGLTLTLSSQGGAVTNVILQGQPVHDAGQAYASGFFMRDVAGESDFVHPGGSLVQDGNIIRHSGTITDLDLEFVATYTATADRIAIHAELTNTQSITERAVTLYFALPISAAGWRWGDDIRTSRLISGTDEFVVLSTEHGGLGATGQMSKYPWAVLSNREQGIVIATPLSSPSVMRLIYNPATHQFYIAFDLGLSPYTAKFPNRAWADLILYRIDGEQGFRAAAQGYYDRFASDFARRVPPGDEGIWLPFTNACTITNSYDFGIGFHELGSTQQITCDDSLNVLSFRYLAEPWSEWLPIHSKPLTNPGFENGSPGSADGWQAFVSGYAVDGTGGRCNGRAISLTNSLVGQAHGAWQYVWLGQTTAMPIYVSGWSKAENVSGNPDLDYSIYLDIYHTDGTWSYGHILTFTTGTHNWEFREGFIIPEKPIEAINVHLLLRNLHTGTAWFDDLALWEIAWGSDRINAAISSGFWNECGRHCYEAYGPGQVPWCPGAAGRNVFILNPDPDIADPIYSPNKANLEWNQGEKDVYTNTPGLPSSRHPGLDGEYIDSFLARATVMDFRRSHFAATDTPLTFRTGSWRVGIPEVFATAEFARWVAQDVHNNLGKWMMANWILRDLPWGADLFDVMGTETNWLPGGVWMPESDAVLIYRRTLAGQRPYNLLMNADLSALTHERVEDYFQIALFYGFYPSIFSQDAATHSYWENPVLYNRDRDLFKKYVPLIRRLSQAGWQPLTYAGVSNPDQVYIERFGQWPNLDFTLRNVTDTTVMVTVTIGQELGLPRGNLCAATLLDRALVRLDYQASIGHTVAITLPPQSTEILAVCRYVFLPIILKAYPQSVTP